MSTSGGADGSGLVEPTDDNVAAVLTGAKSSAAIDTQVDTHLGGDATGLVTSVAGIKPSNGKRAVGQDELVFNIKNYGAMGDGSTDDTAAINATFTAAPAGSSIFFPPGNYLVSGPINVTKTLTVHGPGVIVKDATTVTGGIVWITAANVDWSVSVTDTHASAVYGVVFFQVPDGYLHDCTLDGAGKTICARLAGTDRMCVSNVTINNANIGMILAAPSDGAVIEDNRVTNWAMHGIQIIGNASGTITNLRVTGNRVKQPVGNSVQYPLIINDTSGTVIDHLTISENIVIGNGNIHTATTNNGTSDQISVNNSTNVTVLGNTSAAGGDMGMTIENCQHVTVSGNVIESPQTAGFAIWDSQDVTVNGNTVRNAGQNTAVGAGAAGVSFKTATYCSASGNVFADDQTTPTMKYGVTFVSGCDNIQIGPDVNDGMASGVYYNGTGNTNLTQATTQALS